MNKKIFLIVHLLMLIECRLILTSQLAQQEEIAVEVGNLLVKKDVARKKYADYLAKTPDLDNHNLVEKISTDLIQVVMSFLVMEDFSKALEDDYRAWQQSREKKILMAFVRWQQDDIEYIKENLRLDLWLHEFSQQYNATSLSTEKKAPFYQHLDTLVFITSNIWSFTPSRLYEMHLTEENFNLFFYMQQETYAGKYRNEIEVAALMLVGNQPVQHYLNPYQPTQVKENRLAQAVEYFQSHSRSLYHHNSHDTHGRTLGYKAVTHYFIPVIHMLLQDGIDFTMIVKDKKTVLDRVQEKALQPKRNSCVKNREKYYHVWQILDQAGMKNSTAFVPCPSKKILQDEQDEINRTYYCLNGRYEHEYS